MSPTSPKRTMMFVLPPTYHLPETTGHETPNSPKFTATIENLVFLPATEQCTWCNFFGNETCSCLSLPTKSQDISEDFSDTFRFIIHKTCVFGEENCTCISCTELPEEGTGTLVIPHPGKRKFQDDNEIDVR